MTEPDLQHLEESLREVGRTLPYPPTPPLAGRVASRLNQPLRSGLHSRRWARALFVVLILLSALMLVPPARAAIFDFIQIGVVRIFQITPTPQPIKTPAFETPLTATPAATILPSQLDLAGETTLMEAQSKLGFHILLPAYPVDLGRPDHVYLQDMGSPMLVLVWMDREHPDKVRLSLDEITPGSWVVQKFQPHVIEDTSVNGQAAVWTEGPYFLQVIGNSYVTKRLVEGHALNWTQAGITYRLETDLSLTEAIKIGGALR